MRTTVTLEADVAAKLKALSHRQQTSFKATLNDVLRRGLAAQSSPVGRRQRFVVKAHAGGFRSGIDPDRLNQLLDELEIGDFLAEARGK